MVSSDKRESFIRHQIIWRSLKNESDRVELSVMARRKMIKERRELNNVD